MKEQILQLREQGKTYDEIKEQLGCSKGTIAYHCGEGQKLKTKEANDRRRERNRQWLEDLKSQLKCEKCEESRYWLLDFHHLDPNEKEASIAYLLRSSTKQKVQQEMEKCIVLCSNCHRDLHHQERTNCSNGENGQTHRS